MRCSSPVPPCTWGSVSATRRMLASISSSTSVLKVRTVPRITAWSGSTLSRRAALRFTGTVTETVEAATLTSLGAGIGLTLPAFLVTAIIGGRVGNKVPLTLGGLVTALGLGLIVLLATLQYKWLGQISSAERDRMRASLGTRTTEFDLD